MIDSLTPLLEKGDCIIDGGNAHWEDTIRREKALAEKGLLFVGSGVSGGDFTVTLKTPVAAGVPPIMPVSVLILSPVGNPVALYERVWPAECAAIWAGDKATL